MRVQNILWIALGMLLAGATPASASDPQGHYWSRGYGNKSCGAYDEARQQPNGYDALAFTTWITGYITATNRRLPNTYDIVGNTDIAGVLGWIDNYCHSHPTDTFSGAADE